MFYRSTPTDPGDSGTRNGGDNIGIFNTGKLTRNKNGSFRNWKGGKKDSYHGNKVRIGQEFKRQKGRKAKVGEIIRDKNKNGTHNKGSPWNIRTRFGWRRIRTKNNEKPSKAKIQQIISDARPGRGK